MLCRIYRMRAELYASIMASSFSRKNVEPRSWSRVKDGLPHLPPRNSEPALVLMGTGGRIRGLFLVAGGFTRLGTCSVSDHFSDLDRLAVGAFPHKPERIVIAGQLRQHLVGPPRGSAVAAVRVPEPRAGRRQGGSGLGLA